jgi:hypothetical protein
MEDTIMKRLFAATFVRKQLPETSLWSLDEAATGVDKMKVPTDYHKVVNLCRFFYEHDGMAYTTINKQVEIGINGYAINPGTCSKSELLVYESLNEMIEKFLREAAQEFLISGLVIPESIWDTVKGSDISNKARRNYDLPIDLWYRDPLSIEIKKTPLPNHLAVFVVPSEEEIFFVKNEGKYLDGTEDKEAYRLLVEKYPEFVAAIRAGETKFKLDDPMVIRRYPRSGKIWPTPYITPALELFLHKRNLRKMDYAIASRVISAIQLFKLGNDEYPLTEDDEDIIDELKSQMMWRSLAGNTERVFQLFSNHTLEIDWITPDVEAMLDEGKYRSINEDISIALGLPRIVISGETLRSGTSNANIAMLPPANSIEDFMRRQLLEFPRALYKQVKERNRFKGLPEPYYPPIRLSDITSLTEMGREFYDRGVLSKTGWGEFADINFDTEIERMALEKEETEKLGLNERPDVPYAPAPDKVNKNEGDDSGKEEN